MFKETKSKEDKFWLNLVQLSHILNLKHKFTFLKEEGGRHTPFVNGYRPQFFFRTIDVTGAISLPSDVQMVMLATTSKWLFNFIAPIAVEQGLKFSIREGGRTVGAGSVVEIIE